MAKEKENPEDIYRKKLDMCITDAIIKGGGGLLLGGLASVLIFKRRWPITTGLGIGMGISFANCEYALNNRTNSL
ncbi:MICOS complex subunit Mic10 [Spodoptera frugiperda]|uniref:MICOS complex subunit MIC10 n=1 Tax=Spodoptera frugiperda TaxID=7108 RepID=A0A9R0D132_SPOFR|nr:MICOS complex subunit Mic10 [Spodoptera frugiperda]